MSRSDAQATRLIAGGLALGVIGTGTALPDRRRLPAKLPLLDTQRLLLRALSTADIADLTAIFGDPEVMRYASDPAFTHEGEYWQTIASIGRNLLDDVAIEWGVVLKSSGVMIGVVDLHHFEAAQAEIGCLLAKAYWGQGLMREVLLAIQDFAPGLGLLRLEAEIDVGNVRSEALFSGLGFVQLRANGASAVWLKALDSGQP